MPRQQDEYGNDSLNGMEITCMLMLITLALKHLGVSDCCHTSSTLCGMVVYTIHCCNWSVDRLISRLVGISIFFLVEFVL